MSTRFPPIPEFVEPYPDESCYSILCRCAVRAAVSTAKFQREMFGSHRIMAGYLWQPFHAEDLARWFGDAGARTHIYVQKHSYIPYRYPFFREKNQAETEDWNNGEELSRGIHNHITLELGYRKWKKRFLCYCPECVKEDREKYGETYWHMIPQLPGVTVCPVHAVPLEESSFMTDTGWMDLHSAEYWLPDRAARKETISYEDLCLAVDSKWMMEHGWRTEINIPALLKDLSIWDFEQADAKTRRFTSTKMVKNETLYHILLAYLKGKSISEFVEA